MKLSQSLSLLLAMVYSSILLAAPQAPMKSCKIQVRDFGDKNTVPYFTVDLTSCGHPKYISNADGVFTMQLPEDFACYVMISKSGYTNVQLYIDYMDIQDTLKTYQLFMDRSPHYYFGKVQSSGKSKEYVSDVFVELRDLESQESQFVRSDIRGEYALYLNPRRKYSLHYSHPDYELKSKQLITQLEIGETILGKTLVDPKHNEPIASATPLSVHRKISVPEKNYFSIQVSASSFQPGSMEHYEKSCKAFGELSLHQDNDVFKIRVGKFYSRKKAEEKLLKLREQTPFKDAFLVVGNDQTMVPKAAEVVISTPFQKELPSNYAIRLASYRNPTLFDATKVENLGLVERRLKNEWTIMLLVGFKDRSSAEIARDKAVENGFEGAQIVPYESL